MSDNLLKARQIVYCDMCTEEDRKRARKTCMKCEMSLCVQHLQTHLTTPVMLQTHPLTEPMASYSTTKCPQHGKLLEYYCMDDMVCVCVSCAIEDQHRLHNMKTFPTAHKVLLEKLSAEHEDLQVKTNDENVSLEKWEKREKEKLARSSVSLIGAVTNLRNTALTSVQSSVSARVVSINSSKSSIQAAQKEKDTFRFLQMYSQVHLDVEKAKAVDLRKGLEPGTERDKLALEIRQFGEKMVKQAGHFLGSLLTLVDPENHQELVNTSSDLMFQPWRVGPDMALSKDRRKVFYSGLLGQWSATLLIRSTRSPPDFQRWVVSLSQDYDWTIGVCDKQSVHNLMRGDTYGLSCKGNQLSSLRTDYAETKKERKVSSALITQPGKNEDEALPRPKVVEVFWDFETSSLSFFRRTGQYQREEIITIKMSHNNQDLTPFVQLAKESICCIPCRIWCSCEKDNYKDKTGLYANEKRKQCNTQQDTCSCGAYVGNITITEVVCELQ